ncbi:MAG: hypothetical protein IKD71_08115 [Solobacterium sp.]|nr:hypothetical protein [Solobacterium sp.]
MAEKLKFVKGICAQEHPRKPGHMRYKATYYKNVAQPNGKVKQKVQKTGWFNTEEEARAEAKRLSTTTKQARDKMSNAVKIEDVMREYMANKKKETDGSARTHISHFNVIKTTWNTVLHSPNIKDLTVEDFEAYRTYLLYRYKGSNTKRRPLQSGENGRITWNYYLGLKRTVSMLMVYANEIGMGNSNLYSYSLKGMKAQKPKEVNSSRLKNAQDGKYPNSLNYITLTQTVVSLG